MLNYKYYRSAIHQLANGVAVPLRFAIGRREGSIPRALSHEVAGSKPMLLLHCLFEMFSRKFIVNRKVKNPFDVGFFQQRSSVAEYIDVDQPEGSS